MKSGITKARLQEPWLQNMICLPQAAMTIVAKYGINLTTHHVKSHQEDEDVAYKNLPWEAKLNCDVDKLAGSVHSCMKCNRSPHTSYILPPSHGETLQLGETQITGHLPIAIREASYLEEFQTYIMTCTG